LILLAFVKCTLYFLLSLPQKERKKSRQEVYTTPSWQAVLWHTGATVICTIDLYCTPLLQGIFVIGQWVYLSGEGSCQQVRIMFFPAPYLPRTASILPAIIKNPADLDNRMLTLPGAGIVPFFL
jgi:hypothetical protein